MRRALQSATLALLLATSSACARLAPPRTASDLCLTAQRISAEPAPSVGADDPGNHYDTDETFRSILEHNEVIDRLCPHGARDAR